MIWTSLYIMMFNSQPKRINILNTFYLVFRHIQYFYVDVFANYIPGNYIYVNALFLLSFHKQNKVNIILTISLNINNWIKACFCWRFLVKKYVLIVLLKYKFWVFLIILKPSFFSPSIRIIRWKKGCFPIWV